MNTFQHLDELIAAGYGDIPQTQIPADWRTKSAPKVINQQTSHDQRFEEMRVRQLGRKRERARERIRNARKTRW